MKIVGENRGYACVLIHVQRWKEEPGKLVNAENKERLWLRSVRSNLKKRGFRESILFSTHMFD